MKNQFNVFLTALFLQLTIPLVAGAQSKQGLQTLQAPPADVKVDGDLKEWGDSLRFYNADKKINYVFANDTGNLYVAIRIANKKDQMHVLLAGLTFSIDPKGRKKETYSITFPAPDPNAIPALSARTDGSMQKQDEDEMMQARLTTMRSIKVEGFKDVESEMITTANTYGFKVAINLDADGFMDFEAAVPMRFFHVDDVTKNEWAFNIKINGLGKPGGNKDHDEGGRMGGNSMGGGGRGGMGGGGRGGMGGMGGGRGGNRGGLNNNTSSPESKSTDFWDKFYLSKS
jgi:hypothetical protein